MKFLADENFNNDILRGIWRRIPDAVIVRVQDTATAGAEDPEILAHAAEEGYFLLSHDVNTMGGFFYDRVRERQPVPGLFLAHKRTPVGRVVDDLELIIRASEASEWFGKITYLPLR